MSKFCLTGGVYFDLEILVEMFLQTSFFRLVWDDIYTIYDIVGPRWAFEIPLALVHLVSASSSSTSFIFFIIYLFNSSISEIIVYIIFQNGGLGQQRLAK